MTCPVIFSASGQFPLRQFWTGRSPIFSAAAVPPAVPSRWMPFVFSTMIGTIFFCCAISLSGSAISGSLFPITATAFSFFDPITAPNPHLPLILAFAPSWPIHDIGTSLSPAAPIHDVSHEGPNLSFICSSVWKVSFPHRSPAGSMATLSSLITMMTGVSDIPLTISPSHPERFSVVPNLPPASLSPNIPVSGDLEVIWWRPEVGTFVPVNGPVIHIIGLSGPRGSVSGPVMSNNSLAPIPLPPR